jgi:hypothetical protein
MKRLFFIFAVLLILSASFATAQEQTGVLVGSVTDTDGAFLPGVTVEARSPAQPGVATAITDEMGRYRLIGMSPGTYQVTFRLPGFQTLIREGILVRLGRTFNLEVSIAQATMEEEVTVIGESPVVDIKKSGTTTNYGKEMIAKLPKGRDFTSVVTLTAGVNEENVGGGTMMDGASSSENMYFVDGMDTTSMYTGTSQQRVLMEFVEEVQVKSSGYEAEHGGSMGGVINVITRSGGNEFHGEITGYMRGSALQANPYVKNLRINPVDDVTAEYIDYREDSWNQFEVGLGLGGYVIKDKLWFFASFMPRLTTTDRTVLFEADQTEYTTTEKQRSYFGQAKLTALLGGFRISASYINDYYRWRGSLASQDGHGALPSEYDYPSFGFNYPGQTWGGRIDWIVSDNLFVGANGGWFEVDTQQLKGPTEPRYFFQRSNIGYGASEEHARGWYNYGYYDGYQTIKNIQNRASANLDATLFVDLAGEHVWKAGIQFVRIGQDVDDAYPYDYNRLYWGVNRTSPNFGVVETKYGYLEAREPFGTIAKIHSDRFALFLQDSWTISNRFTLNIGIRAEKEDIPSFSDLPEYQDPPIKFAFADKIAPRVGFAWDLFGDNSTKVFGSYGLYYDVMKLEMAEGSYGGFKWISHYYDMQTLDWRYGDQTHPMNLPGFEYIESLNWRIPSFDTTQPDMEPYSKYEISLGLQRKLGEDVSLTVRYLHNSIRWAIEDMGIQTPHGEEYFNGNPGSDWINDLYASNGWPECPKGKRKYHSVNVGLDKRFSNNWMAGLHYTWSSLWGNFSGLASSDEFGRQSPNVERYWDGWFLHRQQNLEESTGKLPTDRPHQFKVYGSYTWDFGLTVGFYSYAMSGTPVSRMFYLGGMQGYYPVGRFTDGRTPFWTRTDLYVEYNFNLGGTYGLQINANVNNLFGQQIARRVYPYYNRENVYLSDEEMLAGFDYIQVYQEHGGQLEPRFLMPYSYSDGIDIRLGVKFIF